MIKYLCIVIIFLVILSSCQRKNAYTFDNRHLLFVDMNEKLLLESVKKNLRRNFYTVYEKQVTSFFDMNNDIKLVVEKYPPGLIFLDNFTAPILLKENVSISRKGFKLLTYDIPSDDVHLNFDIPTFNFTIDNSMLNKKIINVLKKYSQKNDLSDCGVIVNKDYSRCESFIKDLSNDNFVPQVLNVYEGQENNLISWVTRHKDSLKCILFFSYFTNKALLDDKLDIPNMKYVEVFTNYGQLVRQVQYNINIDWNRCAIYAMKSKKFRRFTKTTKFEKKDDKFINFIINYKDVIEIRKNLTVLKVAKKKEKK